MRFFSILAITILLYSCNSKSNNYNQPNDFAPVSINNGWVFQAESDEAISVNLPHIPRIEPLIVNDQWQGKHTYTKVLNLKAVENQNTFLHFEGVMHEATVFVNGKKLKKHVGGYLPFSVDLTGHIVDGDNEIHLEVSNSNNENIPPGKPLEELDFNYYGGIYRDVWLIRKNHIYITDPFIENTNEAGWLINFDDVLENKASGTLRLHIKNDSDINERLTIKVKLSQSESIHEFQQELTIEHSESELTSVPVEIDSPLLWSTTNPNLYDLEIQVLSSDGIALDQIEDRVGIRKIELRNNGFYLNGETQFIRGTNRHQEYPYIGYAISNNANYRDALKIKNAGFDFVRLSHYPQDETFLDACDELGLLVMNAIPGWQFYQEGAFTENSFQDIRDMIRRDRNHPSVVFWEVSLNESQMTNEYIQKANEILKEELPFENIYSAGWMDHPAYDLFIPARQHSTPPHYWNKYRNGERSIFISEYGDWEYYAHNAGFNQSAFTDLSDEERNSRQLRSHGEARLLQQAMNFQEAANSNRRGLSTIGHSNWLMFDYNRGYADDIEASGIADIFRIPKFTYFFYRSQRSPEEVISHQLVDQGPMVKIASYWTDDSPTNIRVFSNCEQVDLWLNDSLIAMQTPTIKQFSDQLPHPPFEFVVNHFEPGKLTARGFINGNMVAMDNVYTPGNPNALRLSIDALGGGKEELNDIIFVYAEVIDSAGTLVPNSTNKVQFELSGKGELIGVNPVNAEAGIASILFKGDVSEIMIKASSQGLIPDNYKNSIE